ncbi:hypothetical protein AM2010_431 [Pelagerythrobacter marensis]|uniref:Uncharacterized protein n=2 Tax=Pelagerythrobacter marensis TaxID=543877 RepID=A0A0G3X855_9SPHN|nr:hypothetical protein AM2010_431 [Pelagerythrobacter marensis]
MIGGSRLRQIGWAVVLGVCLAAFVVLTFRVNAVKSEVRLAERQIVALEREKLMLETEFETRANQRQLADWNRVEFGYQAPRSDQYLDSERQLAALGLPRAVDAPDPIRVARARQSEEVELAAMVSPLTGKPAQSAGSGDGRQEMAAPRSLAERLSDGTRLGASLAEVAE